MSVPIGQPIRLTFLTYSDAALQTLADPTTVSIDVLDPAGVTTTFTLAGAQVVRDSLGTFHLDYTPTVAGHYSFHWSSTGTVTTAQDGSFDVNAEYNGNWISLADAKAETNITGSTNDAELAGFIDAAQDVVRGFVGDVTATTYTDSFVTDTSNPWPYHYGTWPRYTYGPRTVDLRHRPVLRVTSVAVSSMDGSNSQTLASTSYRLDATLGTVTVIDGSFFGPLVTVTYTAGRASLPASVRLATLLIIEHLWEQTQRGSGAGRSVPGSTPEPDISYGPSKYSQAMELLSPSQLPPVIA